MTARLLSTAVCAFSSRMSAALHVHPSAADTHLPSRLARWPCLFPRPAADLAYDGRTVSRRFRGHAEGRAVPWARVVWPQAGVGLPALHTHPLSAPGRVGGAVESIVCVVAQRWLHVVDYHQVSPYSRVLRAHPRLSLDAPASPDQDLGGIGSNRFCFARLRAWFRCFACLFLLHYFCNIVAGGRGGAGVTASRSLASFDLQPHPRWAGVGKLATSSPSPGAADGGCCFCEELSLRCRQPLLTGAYFIALDNFVHTVILFVYGYASPRLPDVAQRLGKAKNMSVL